MSTNNMEIFLRFLNNELLLPEFENFISRTPDLESELGMDIYIHLLTFNFRDKNSTEHLKEYIFRTIINEGDFESWKIKTLLQEFIMCPVKCKILLDKIYHLFRGSVNESGEIVNGYSFLKHLGLNYLHWIDEGYCKYHYGKNWQVEYEKSLLSIPYYHNQLKPIAVNILNAIEGGEIFIIKRGEYNISDKLRQDFEGQKIFELKDPIIGTGG